MKSSYARALPFACNIAIRPGDVVFAVDRAGRFVYWNRNAQAVIGRSPATVAGLPLAAVFPEHEGGPDRARLDLSAVMAGRDYAGAFRASRADGSGAPSQRFDSVAKHESIGALGCRGQCGRGLGGSEGIAAGAALCVDAGISGWF